MENSEPVLVLVEDLFFAAKITGTARATGKKVRLVSSPELLMDALRGGEHRLVIVDLHATGYDPVEVIRELKGRGASQEAPRVLGFYSHVQVDLARRAREAGCDDVMPRSVFAKRLAEIL